MTSLPLNEQKSDAAKAQFVRTSTLVQAGVLSRDKLGAAEAAAQTAHLGH
jgi:multidrug resistance efflux pump